MSDDRIRAHVIADEGRSDDHTMAAMRDAYRWRFNPDECKICGERIGHFNGCSLAPPDGVPRVEVRPNCFAVRRHRIGAAIRVACEARGVA